MVHEPSTGKNTLANLMKTISKQAGLSREFTNHSIRATSSTVLDVNKFSDRDIMCVSGHKSESYITNYTGRVTTKRKYEISNALCASVINSVQVELRLSQERLDWGIKFVPGTDIWVNGTNGQS
jgi:predicted metal-dependent peptidase